MDLVLVNFITSLVSAVMMIAAVVYILTYILGSYSSRSGVVESPKLVIGSLIYFFGTTIFLFMGVEWLTELARTREQTGMAFYLNIGASALALNALLHILCGSLTILLYLRGRGNLVSTLKRVLTR